MSPQFALRWTLIALLCAVVIVGLGVLLSFLQPVSAPPPRQVTVDDLMAAVEMPLSPEGAGMQIISGTTLAFKLEPYPARASEQATVTLIAIAPDGHTPAEVAPVLWVAPPATVEMREFTMTLRPEGGYAASGVFFPQPGPWRLRVDVNVGDNVPTSMLTTIEAR